LVAGRAPILFWRPLVALIDSQRPEGRDRVPWDSGISLAEPHVISALRAKRAELSGDLIAAQKRLEKLRDDLDAVDRTLRVFDPRQHPEKIRPVVKRKGDRMFGYGECTRAILNALRDAPGR
jgi:hypothetical protein